MSNRSELLFKMKINFDRSRCFYYFALAYVRLVVVDLCPSIFIDRTLQEQFRWKENTHAITGFNGCIIQNTQSKIFQRNCVHVLAFPFLFFFKHTRKQSYINLIFVVRSPRSVVFIFCANWRHYFGIFVFCIPYLIARDDSYKVWSKSRANYKMYILSDSVLE